MTTRDKIQNFGRSMSSMVMPNIGAFIAWGLITAIFMPTGWFPNEHIDALREPMLRFLLPLLIGYTGGYNIYQKRGGVAGAVATAGAIVGGDVPMFIGAMIMGPLGGWLIKKFDQKTEGRIRAGFEMLVNNFSLGILGMLLAIFAFFTLGRSVTWLSLWVGEGIKWMMEMKLLPLVSIIIEPAKVMFLNNAVNHGILTPLGVMQLKEAGESIIFILESNPGPGFGMLMAFCLFGRGVERASAPGAVLIQFIGGIHEIYYPYVFAHPALILSLMCGSSAFILFMLSVNAGMLGVISPGSIISVILMSPPGKTFLILLAEAIAAGVSFTVAAFILKLGHKNTESDPTTLKENPFTPDYKKESGKRLMESIGATAHTEIPRHIVFSCDAGMGSSALGATRFRERIKTLQLDVKVTHSSVSDIPSDADIVVCQKRLAQRARGNAPQVQVIEIDNFLQDPALDSLFESLQALCTSSSSTPAPKEDAETEARKTPEDGVITPELIMLQAEPKDKWEAIRMAASLLEEAGCTDPSYADEMIKRETEASTYMGMGLAIPHGTAQAKQSVSKTSICVVQCPQGVMWDDEQAHLVIGIAAKGEEHLELLQKICEALEDESKMEKIKNTTVKNDIISTLK